MILVYRRTKDGKFLLSVKISEIFLVLHWIDITQMLKVVLEVMMIFLSYVSFDSQVSIKLSNVNQIDIKFADCCQKLQHKSKLIVFNSP